MKSTSSNVWPHRQAGVSLIELMIAVLLGAIVVAGLIQILTANRKAYQMQESNNFQQQNLRFASDSIDWSVRMADFWGGAKSDNIQGLMGSDGGSSCDAKWILAGKTTGSNGSGGIYGYDGAAAFPIPGCGTLVPASDYIAGTDVLVVRYADTDPCNVEDGSPTLVTATCPPASSDYLVANVGQQAQLFSGTTIPVTGNTRRYIYPFRIEVYYLRPCSDLGTAGKCTAASDGGNPQPTLMRLRLDGTNTPALKSEPLVEGIEQLQFDYGLSPNISTSKVVGQFKAASEMTASDWPNVLAVRVTMLARSQVRDIAVPHGGAFVLSQTASSSCGYTIDGGGTVTLTSTGTNCTGFNLTGLKNPQQFSRQMFQQVVQVRNRIRG